MGFLEWLQFSPVGNFVATTLWAYPLLETLHSLGMALLLGSLGLMNLRVLGFKRDLPLLGTRELMPLAWLGFTVNAVSGVLLFTSDPVTFFNNYMFRIKLLLILLAGINAWLLGTRVFAPARAAAGGYVPAAGAKLIAASSLVFWIGAIVAGRLIAYTH